MTSNWIEAARRQLTTTPLEVRARALRHALGFGPPLPAAPPSAPAQPTAEPEPSKSAKARARRAIPVIIAGVDAELETELRKARFPVTTINFTPFNAEEAAKIPFFDTYNRTAASQRVADVVDALRATPDAVLIAAGDAALAGLLAVAVETERRAILDVGDFDTASDAVLVSRLYMPGLRRAGDLSTAAALAGDRAVIHNAGPRFKVEGAQPKSAKLTAKEIVALLKQ